MDAIQDILQDKWPELKGQAKQHWGKLIDDDIQRLSGTTEELSSLLRQRYGDRGAAGGEVEVCDAV